MCLSERNSGGELLAALAANLSSQESELRNPLASEFERIFELENPVHEYLQRDKRIDKIAQHGYR